MRDITVPDADTIARILSVTLDVSGPVRDAVADYDATFGDSHYADGYARGVADAWVYCHTVGSASGSGDTDTGGPGAEVDAFADRAAHRIAAAITLTQPHSALTHTLCDDYTQVYNVARDRLRSLAATETRNRAGDGRGRDGGAS